MNINATLFIEMVVFMSFVGLTRHYVWPPIIKVIDQRQADINKGIEDARQASKKLETAKKEADDILQKARNEYKRLISQAEHTVIEMIEGAKEEAQTLKEEHIASAQNSIITQINQEKMTLKKHTLSFVENVLHKVIVKLPDQPQLDTMINQAIGEIDAQD